MALPPSQPRTAASSSSVKPSPSQPRPWWPMISSDQLGAVLADWVPAFFMIEVAARGPGVALGSPAIARMAVSWKARQSISLRGDAACAGRRRRCGPSRRCRRSPWRAARSELAAAERQPPPPPRRRCPGVRAAAAAWRSSSRRSAARPGSSFGTFTSVKKVSQNGEAPAISWIGRTSTPGWCMSISRKRDALMLLRGVGAHQAEAPVGPLRAAGPDLLAVDQEVVALVLGLGLQARRGRSRRPARRSPGTSASRRVTIGGMCSCFCSSVPYSSSVGPNIITPMPPIGL